MKPTTPKPRPTKRGYAVKIPSKFSLPTKPSNIATGAKKTANPKPTSKVTKKPVLTPRKRLDPSKMTPAQKDAYYKQPGYDNY